MNFKRACAAASAFRDGCVHHVNATILTNAYPPKLAPAGYVVSDWTDGSTVRSFVDGEELEGRPVPVTDRDPANPYVLAPVIERWIDNQEPDGTLLEELRDQGVIAPEEVAVTVLGDVAPDANGRLIVNFWIGSASLFISADALEVDHAHAIQRHKGN